MASRHCRHEITQARTGDRIDGAERLVEQQHRRFGKHRARQCNPLGHAARQGARQRIGVATQPDFGQQ